MLSTSFFLVCLTIPWCKHPGFFGERKSTSNRKDNYRKSW